ncbi:hypothetical protein [Candidatus Paracaedibacter symbiosus]|uniref:hypothetical protein n=1 Tax=Candidatus Paracaedibacter symbiosus TaxID=244582 RepID=UPI0018DE6904|nr:hypothetical protein [Candidatus Paracaedibacter symbiosus]
MTLINAMQQEDKIPITVTNNYCSSNTKMELTVYYENQKEAAFFSFNVPTKQQEPIIAKQQEPNIDFNLPRSPLIKKIDCLWLNNSIVAPADNDPDFDSCPTVLAKSLLTVENPHLLTHIYLTCSHLKIEAIFETLPKQL